MFPTETLFPPLTEPARLTLVVDEGCPIGPKCGEPLETGEGTNYINPSLLDPLILLFTLRRTPSRAMFDVYHRIQLENHQRLHPLHRENRDNNLRLWNTPSHSFPLCSCL